MHQVHEDAIATLGDSLPGQARLLLQAFAVAQLLSQVVLAVKELAALAENAAHDLGVVELGADFSLVVGRQMRLRHELRSVVRIAATLTILAVAVFLDVAAHLSFLHLRELLGRLVAVSASVLG